MWQQSISLRAFFFVSIFFFLTLGLVPKTAVAIPPTTDTHFGNIPFEQTAKIILENGVLGGDIALDGNTAVIPHNPVAYVFHYDGTTWSLQDQLVAADGPSDDSFGNAVAISNDTIIIGARTSDVNGNENQGAAYVFVRNGSGWSQQAKLVGNDSEAGDWFGQDVALEGDTAVVGAWSHSVNGNNAEGAAYVFVRNGTTWSQQAKLIANDGGFHDSLGETVDISGQRVIVGAAQATVDGHSRQGAVYIFVRNGSNWSQEDKLIAADGSPYKYFGESVAIYDNTALIGTSWEEVNGKPHGAAYIFERDGSNWSQQIKLKDNNSTVGDGFGLSVDLGSDTAVVSSVGKNMNRGAVFVFTRQNNSWSQESILTASDSTENGGFGISVSLDGPNLLIFSYNIYDKSGALYVFRRLLPTYGLTLGPDAGRFTGAGYTLSHPVSLVNEGNVQDTYELALSDFSWPSTVAEPTVMVNAGDTVHVIVAVQVPENAPPGQSDSVTLTVTSQSDNSVTSSVVLTTEVIDLSFSVFAPLLFSN